jgi:peptide/nickel transport system permease protein
MAGSTRASVTERFSHNRIGLAGAVIVAVCLIVAVLAPLLAPYGPEETHPNWRLFAPNEYFLLGTDEFGRDILSRVMFGARARAG